MDINSINMNFLSKRIMGLALSKNTPLFYRYIMNAKDFKGLKYAKSIQTAAPTTGGSFSGLDKFNIADENLTQQLQFPPKFYYENITVADTDVTINSSDSNAAAKLLEAKIAMGVEALVDGVEEQLTNSDGSNAKKFLGLKGLIDDGTVLGTYGGLSRSTFSVIQANRIPVGAGLTAFSQLRTGETLARKGGKVVTWHLTTPTLWNTLEALTTYVTNTNTFNVGYAQMTRLGKLAPAGSSMGANIGLDAINFSGKPVVAGDHVESNRWYMLNDDINFYGLPMVGKNYHAVNIAGDPLESALGVDTKNCGLTMTDMKMPIDQAGQVGQIILGGEFISMRPNNTTVEIFS